jgi:hypothetical protein
MTQLVLPLLETADPAATESTDPAAVESADEPLHTAADLVVSAAPIKISS